MIWRPCRPSPHSTLRHNNCSSSSPAQQPRSKMSNTSSFTSSRPLRYRILLSSTVISQQRGQFPPSELTPGDKHLVSQAAPTFNLRFIYQVDLRTPVQHDLICAQQKVSCVQRERESRFFHPRR